MRIEKWAGNTHQGLVNHFEGCILILCKMEGHWRILKERMSLLDFVFRNDLTAV